MKKDNSIRTFQIIIYTDEYTCPAATSAQHKTIVLSKDANKPDFIPVDQVVNETGIM